MGKEDFTKIKYQCMLLKDNNGIHTLIKNLKRCYESIDEKGDLRIPIPIGSLEFYDDITKSIIRMPSFISNNDIKDGRCDKYGRYHNIYDLCKCLSGEYITKLEMSQRKIIIRKTFVY